MIGCECILYTYLANGDQMILKAGRDWERGDGILSIEMGGRTTKPLLGMSTNIVTACSHVRE